MSMRTSDRKRSRIIVLAAGAALGLVGLAVACSQGGGSGGSSNPGPGATATPTPTATASASGQVSCAIGGALNYSETCTVERVLVDGAPVLVIRHADGGFRRFDVLPGGTLAEADGAVRATVLGNGTTLEITIGSDRYRLAASLLGNAS